MLQFFKPLSTSIECTGMYGIIWEKVSRAGSGGNVLGEKLCLRSLSLLHVIATASTPCRNPLAREVLARLLSLVDHEMEILIRQ